MAARSQQLKVVISGDTSQLNRALGSANKSLDKFGKDTSLHARVTSRGFSGIALAAKGATAGIGGLAVGAGFLIKQYEESAKIGRQTAQVIKSTGGAANITAKQVGNLATAISNKTGVDDEAIQSTENLLLTFTNLRNETGKGNDIFNQTTMAVTDMSAALGQDGKSSAIQLGKALNDPIKGITALSRVGVSFTAQQKDQIKTLVESGKTLDAQKLILKEVNKEFGGSAAAQATPFDKLKVSAGNLAETLGGHLAPLAEKAATFMNKLLIQMQNGTGTGGRIIATMKDVARVLGDAGAVMVGTFNTVRAAISSFVSRNRESLKQLGEAFANIGKAIRFVFEEIVLPVIKRALPGIRQVFQGIIRIAKGLVQFFTGVFTGDFGKAWDGIKSIFSGALKALGGIIRAGTAGLRAALSAALRGMLNGAKEFLGGFYRFGANIIKSILNGIGSVAGGIAKKIKGVVGGALNIAKNVLPFGDGIGRTIGKGITPRGGGSLMGANAALAPFAGAASRFGLHVSSGRRPGSITSSGNVSYHSSGEAIDLADGKGPDSNKLRFFNYMKNTFGGRLAELIYTPGGVGIKNGRPYRYTGRVAADHFDHVHVALDTGRPGIGDGIGKKGLANLWAKAGGPASAANLAAAVAMAESGGNPRASNRNTDGSVDRGLWQINSIHGGLSVFGELANAKAAVKISNKGKNWHPWVAYNNGAYRKFLNPVVHAGSAKSSVSKGKGSASLPSKFKVPGMAAGIGGWNVDGSTSAVTSAIAGDSQMDGGGDDGSQALADAIQAQAEAIQAQTEAIQAQAEIEKSLRDEVARQNNFAESVTAVTGASVARAVADLMSGQVVGVGLQGRNATAGGGAVVRY